MAVIRSPFVLVPLAIASAVTLGFTFDGWSGNVATAVAKSTTNTTTPAASLKSAPVSPRAILATCGISPATLAAAGCSSSDATSVVIAAKSFSEQFGQSLADARDTLGAARKTLASSKKSNDPEALSAAQAGLTDAEAAVSSLTNTALDTVTAPLSSTERTLLATISANKGRDLPLAYLTVTRTDSEWVALRDALAIRKDCAAKSTTEPDTITSLIASVESQTEVGQALAAAQNSLAGIEAAWTAALVAE